MSVHYQTFERGALKTAAKEVNLKDHRVEYKAFQVSSDNSHVNTSPTSLVVVCGAFESYNLHRNLVLRMIKHQPVLLVSLPGLGGNEEIPDLIHFDELAEVLKGFIEYAGLSQVALIGSSAAASVVSSFCCTYPEIVKKAVVHGIAHRPRKSWQMLLEESLYWIDEKHWEQNAEASLLYLINEDYLEETRFPSLYKRYFTRRLANFDAKQLKQFKFLVQMLLNEDGLQGYPETDILVCTGEYDHFTLPFEHAEYADQCPNSRFALVENADHLLHFERQKETLELFENYLTGKDIDHVDGVKVFAPQTFCELERRSESRFIPVNKKARLYSSNIILPEDFEGEPPKFAKVKVRNINFSGCLLELSKEDFNVVAHTRDLVLHLEAPKLSLEILAFDQCDHTMRCVFKHKNYSNAIELKSMLDDWDYFRSPQRKKTSLSDDDLDDGYDDLLVGY